MTDEQINAAIAEACGWTRLEQRPPNGKFWGQHPACPNEVNEYYDWPIPNYCTDLNAMHEAEKILMHADLLFEYGMHISIDHRYDYLLRATACQRAEAFLRTLGKWDDQSGDATEMEVQK